MAVTITVAMLRVVVQGVLGVPNTRLERLLAVAAAHVTRYAPAAPTECQNEAVCRFVGYMLNSNPNNLRRLDAGGLEVEVSNNHAPMFRNSGAAALLAPWRTRRAGVVGATAATAPTPEPTPAFIAQVRLAIRADANFGPADFTFHAVGTRITVPTDTAIWPAGDLRYLALARPAAAGAIDTLYSYAPGADNTINRRRSWVALPALTIDGGQWAGLRTRVAHSRQATGQVWEIPA